MKRGMQVGDKFSRLKLIEKIGKCGTSNYRGVFLCDCGQIKELTLCNVKSGKTRSCGCLQKEVAANSPLKKHGMSGSREYSTWTSMMNRCYLETTAKFEIYGGRGISVCDEWHDFEKFHRDMGSRPEGKTLDRIDSDGNYEPKNCRWADLKTQNRNQRKRKASASRFMGVEKHHSGKWGARIRTDDKRVWLGLFETEEAAGIAYQNAKHERDGGSYEEL